MNRLNLDKKRSGNLNYIGTEISASDSAVNNFLEQNKFLSGAHNNKSMSISENYEQNDLLHKLIMQALSEHEPHAAVFLIRSKVPMNVEFTDSTGRNLLHYLAMHCCDPYLRNVLSKILDRGLASRKEIINCQDHANGNTPLHYVLNNTNIDDNAKAELVKQFIEKGANSNLKNNTGVYVSNSDTVNTKANDTDYDIFSNQNDVNKNNANKNNVNKKTSLAMLDKLGMTDINTAKGDDQFDLFHKNSNNNTMNSTLSAFNESTNSTPVAKNNRLGFDNHTDLVEKLKQIGVISQNNQKLNQSANSTILNNLKVSDTSPENAPENTSDYMNKELNALLNNQETMIKSVSVDDNKDIRQAGGKKHKFSRPTKHVKHAHANYKKKDTKVATIDVNSDSAYSEYLKKSDHFLEQLDKQIYTKIAKQLDIDVNDDKVKKYKNMLEKYVNKVNKFASGLDLKTEILDLATKDKINKILKKKREGSKKV